MLKLKLIFLLMFCYYASAQQSVKEYFIECSPEDFDMIYKNFEEDIYIPITLSTQDNTWTNVRMRIRGDTSRKKNKKSLKVKFDGELYSNGRDVLNFNAEYDDPSYIHQHLATRLMNESGHYCYNSEHARLFLNGKFFGLYLIVENVDEDFLVSRGLDPNGNLYKATLDDASLSIFDDVDVRWEKKTNTGSGREDLAELVDKLNSVPDEDYLTYAKSTFDYDKMINIVAMNILIANASTYYHNYHMYHDINNTGKWTMFPWDMDKAFAHFGKEYSYSLSSKYWTHDNPFVERMFLIPEIFLDLKNRIDVLAGSIFKSDYIFPIIDSLVNVLEVSVAEDTTDKIESIADWKTQIDWEKDYFSSRYNFIKNQMSKAPLSFRVDRLRDVYSEEIRFVWHPSKSPRGKAISYELRYSPLPWYNVPEATIIKNITDTTYLMEDLPPDDNYFWQVVVTDGEYTIEGTDDFNRFYVKRSSSVPCTITGTVTLTKENSPYIADCDITIENGAELIIEKGVELRLGDAIDIDVEGSLQINGTSGEPVIIRPDLGVDNWGIIRYKNPLITYNILNANITAGSIGGFFEEGDIGEINIDGMIFTNTKQLEFDHLMIQLLNCDVTVSNSEIIGNGTGQGLLIVVGSATILNSRFVNIPDAIECTGLLQGLIDGNTILDSGDDAIDINGSSDFVVKNNIIYNSSDKGLSIGSDFYGPSLDIIIERNLIVNCKIGISVKSGSHALIKNNTLYGNEYSIDNFRKESTSEDGGHAVIVNTIISASEKAAIKLDQYSSAIVSYSLCDTKELPGEGNIFDNPRFVSPGIVDYTLRENSPCIDAGDPDINNDPDGTRSDIGAFYFDHNNKRINIVINEINYNSATDPDPDDWVEFYNPNQVEVDISNWYFQDEDNAHKYIFPDGTVISADGFLVLSKNTLSFNTVFPLIKNYIGDMGFGLSGSGELIRLYDRMDRLIDSLTYGDSDPWPTEPDGKGPTLELMSWRWDNSQAKSWNFSDANGTPGRKNSTISVPRDIKLKFTLNPNYPNPFISSTMISFEKHSGSYTSLKIYDIFGEEVAVIVEKYLDKGIYEYEFDSGYLSQGIYYFELSDYSGSINKMMVKIDE